MSFSVYVSHNLIVTSLYCLFVCLGFFLIGLIREMISLSLLEDSTKDRTIGSLYYYLLVGTILDYHILLLLQ